MSFVTAVQDRLELTLDQVKTYLSITGIDEDNNLEMWLETAKEEADSYMNNNFWLWDSERDCYVQPLTPRPIPTSVKIGVLEWLKAKRRDHLLNTSDAVPIAGGLVEEKIGDVSFKYAGGGSSSSPSNAARFRDAVKDIEETYWSKYKLIVIGAAGG